MRNPRVRRPARPLLAAGLLLLAGVLAWPQPARSDETLIGRLLVATPGLSDSNFDRTVVFMLQHDRGGALGIVVNRPLGEVPLAGLLALLPEPEGEAPAESGPDALLPVFYGGPVEPYRAFTLHSRDVMPENSVPVDEETAFNVQGDVLRALAGGPAPARTLFALGYSGWAPGQLESELERGDWFVVAADQALIFNEEPARTWEQAVARYTPEL